MSNSSDFKVEPTVLTREYDAPIERVFEAWTKTEHLKNWQFPQKGFVCEYVRDDIRSGGSTLHRMTTPNGHEMWLLTQYEHVSPPDTLVFRQYSSNEAGDILANAQMPNWPKEMRATVKLEDMGGKTKMQFIWEPVDPSEQEAKAFDASRSQHGDGWGGGFDQLAGYLGTLQ